MTIDKMIDLTDGISPKADKMRVLERAGYARADIARFLGVRYQQVRNTLEGDRRTGYAPEIVALSPIAGSEALPDVTGGFRPIAVGDDGFANLPPDLIDGLAREGRVWAIAVANGVLSVRWKG